MSCIELKEGVQVYLLNLWALKKLFNRSKTEIYVGGFPFSIADIKNLCGKKVTISKIILHSHPINEKRLEEDPNRKIKYVKIKEDNGKFFWIPTMFDVKDHSDIQEGDRVRYRYEQVLARVHSIQGGKFYLEFDEKTEWTHDCGKRVPSGRGWLAFYEDLKKLPSQK